MKSLDFLFWWEGHFERGYGKSLGASESNLLLIWQNSTKMLNFIRKGFGSVFKKNQILYHLILEQKMESLEHINHFSPDKNPRKPKLRKSF